MRKDNKAMGLYLLGVEAKLVEENSWLASQLLEKDREIRALTQELENKDAVIERLQRSFVLGQAVGYLKRLFSRPQTD